MRPILVSTIAQIAQLASIPQTLDRLDARVALPVPTRHLQEHRAPRHAPIVVRGITRVVRRVRALHVRRGSRHLLGQVLVWRALTMVGPPMTAVQQQTTVHLAVIPGSTSLHQDHAQDVRLASTRRRRAIQGHRARAAVVATMQHQRDHRAARHAQQEPGEKCHCAMEIVSLILRLGMKFHGDVIMIPSMVITFTLSVSDDHGVYFFGDFFSNAHIFRCNNAYHDTIC